ncbi:MAG: hypothetical protein A3G38_00960 [Omnitrophica WOR_2 bacterium RIFCSPLOWO2_12_FULL_51_8]|nr:MAG: hypothetical protein A3G38_00960 [Omnitrophica WOR_2 bacterium RIFCSPLOWO2_12_FULL_51_8]
MDRRVAVTGLGVVSSIGIGKAEFWDNLIKGKAGISKVSRFDTSSFKRHYAGEIKGFNPEDFIPKNKIRFLGRASRFAITAAKLALQDAKIPLSEIKNKKICVAVGTTMAEASVMDASTELFIRDSAEKITSRLMLNAFAPSIPRNLGFFLKSKGVNLLIPTACAAGNYAIGYCFDLIRSGETSLAIAAGSDALSQVAFQGFQKLYAMAPEVCAPFDKNRKGMLLGEGAGVLILESFARAKARNAPIYVEVLGYGLSCDAHHITIPKSAGIKKAMEKALKNSNLNVKDLGYISAHGTGTIQNDKEESAAIKELFAGCCRDIPVSSIKSMLGHCMGAASSIEAISCCLALKDGVIPPTINFKTPDPECDLDCVPNQARRTPIKTALNNSFAFGGNNCCVVFSTAR